MTSRTLAVLSALALAPGCEPGTSYFFIPRPDLEDAESVVIAAEAGDDFRVYAFDTSAPAFRVPLSPLPGEPLRLELVAFRSSLQALMLEPGELVPELEGLGRVLPRNVERSVFVREAEGTKDADWLSVSAPSERLERFAFRGATDCVVFDQTDTQLPFEEGFFREIAVAGGVLLFDRLDRNRGVYVTETGVSVLSAPLPGAITAGAGTTDGRSFLAYEGRLIETRIAGSELQVVSSTAAPGSKPLAMFWRSNGGEDELFVLGEAGDLFRIVWPSSVEAIANIEDILGAGTLVASLGEDRTEGAIVAATSRSPFAVRYAQGIVEELEPISSDGVRTLIWVPAMGAVVAGATDGGLHALRGDAWVPLFREDVSFSTVRSIAPTKSGFLYSSGDIVGQFSARDGFCAVELPGSGVSSLFEASSGIIELAEIPQPTRLVSVRSFLVAIEP